MKRPIDIKRDRQTMQTLTDLSTIFETIAGMRIAQIKNQALSSQKFFEELWGIYTQIRIDKEFRFGQAEIEEVANKELVVVITAEGGFSGDIDQKLMNLMLSNYDETKQDIIVIGQHGAIQLVEAGLHFKKYFKLPMHDQDINVSPLILEVQQYRSTTVYYQTYVSLMIQDVKRIELGRIVQERALQSKSPQDQISEKTYIFEPSVYEVVDHLERSMLNIALSQVILESKLAQYASRFRAMTTAHDRAGEATLALSLEYNRAKRLEKDARLKEVTQRLRSMAP